MVRIDDVARAAGVSISTVSYALSGKRPVSADTRRRIQQVIAELGYQPNAGAAMLAGHRTHIFAVTEPFRSDTHAPTHMAFVLALSIAARRHDYDLLLLTDEEATRGMQRVASSGLVDAILVLDVAPDDERADLARGIGTPSVFIGVPENPSGLLCVDLDFDAAGALAVRTLADAGHRNIGFLGQTASTYEHSNFARRLRQGFQTEAARLDLACTLRTSGDQRPSVQAVREALDAFTAAGVTAVVLHATEDVHSAALEIFAGRGIRIPRDVSVLTVGNSFDTASLVTPLDDIPLVPAMSCDAAVALALECVDGAAPAPAVTLIDPILRGRGSVAPPQRRA